MILSHTINFRNNSLNIVVDYDADNRSVEFFNYATITDEKGEVDISDMFTSYLNGEEIMENIDWSGAQRHEVVYEFTLKG